MANYNIDEELTVLEGTKEQIKQAIIDKGQSVLPSDSFRSYADKIEAIETGSDTGDATAVAGDIATGKTAYARGSKITGTVAEVVSGAGTSSTFHRLSRNTSYTELSVVSSFDYDDKLMRQGSTTITEVPVATLSEYIGLTADKIKKDETIMNITGTYEGTGIDTSDATATASDIVGGKTAYVKGSKITGNVQELPLGVIFETNTVVDRPSPQTIVIRHDSLDRDYLIREDAYVGTEAPYSKVANAIGLTANKLKKDEVVLGITGSYEGSGIDTSDATATADDMAFGVTSYARGSKITGNVRTISSTGQIAYYATSVTDSGLLTVNFRMGEPTLYRSGALITVSAGNSDVASALNLTSDKIAIGNTILGVVGSYEGIDTSDATATAGDIKIGKTAYVDSQKVTGVADFGIVEYETVTELPVSADIGDEAIIIDENNRFLGKFDYDGSWVEETLNGTSYGDDYDNCISMCNRILGVGGV